MRHGADEIDGLVPVWERDGLSPSLIANLELGKRASRLALLLEQALRPDLAELGLTYAEFDVLATLRRVGEPYRLKPGDLARALLLTTGGISNMLQRLERAGHVERESDTGDKRSRWVRLTPEGLRVCEAALEMSGRVYEDMLSGVPDETVRRAADALRDVLVAMGRRRLR
ncbi:MarR family winged helix-turn-helix transcriptional regulator [Thermomonospora amylolytica]|uniref:MarR family winged helix-turn-helix transcriptional regulator n=1 Tax=Thermomonospora amylolytica TaxID=1411117 RepID=UPI001300AE31|nr:MarR family transcriptional regulator [Thermomonospora amylolytica]